MMGARSASLQSSGPLGVPSLTRAWQGSYGCSRKAIALSLRPALLVETHSFDCPQNFEIGLWLPLFTHVARANLVSVSIRLWPSNDAFLLLTGSATRDLDDVDDSGFWLVMYLVVECLTAEAHALPKL